MHGALTVTITTLTAVVSNYSDTYFGFAMTAAKLTLLKRRFVEKRKCPSLDSTKLVTVARDR